MTGKIKLHLGCERITPAGWINLDGSWGAWLAGHRRLRSFLKFFHVFPQELLQKPWDPGIVVHDVRKPLPFPDNSAVVIYTSHLLEHLYLTEARRLLRECRRVLVPGGILRVVVPDLRAMVMDYLAGKTGGDWVKEAEGLTPADVLNKRLLLREERPPQGNIIYRLYSICKDFHSHKWMYDAESLAWHLEQAGFGGVREMPALESRIADISEVERLERIAGGAGICVEGVKPGKTS